MDSDIGASGIDDRVRLAPIEQAIANGQIGGAIRLAEQALAQGLITPMLLNLRALKAEAEGRLGDSLADLQRAAALAPEDVSVLNALGICLTAMGRFGEAVDALKKATALAGDFPQAWNNLGVALLAYGDLQDARASFETAAGLHDGFAEPRGHLALMAARRGDQAAAREAAGRALAIKPNLSEAVRAMAEVDLADGRAIDAERRLRALLADPELGPNGRYYAQGLLGDALDQQERYPQAFEAYQAANLSQQNVYRARFEPSGLVELIESIRLNLPQSWPISAAQVGADAASASASKPARQHVFLIGFMRSGTTLIEQVLAAQPDTVTLEEKEVLNSGVLAFLASADGIRRLASADEATLAPHREDYWARVRDYGVDYADKIFVDKMPFDGLRLPLIRRLFPEAKIIFTVRDPRDVIFSCFKHRFAVTTYTYELLTLPTAVRFYDAYMKSVDAFRGLSSPALYQYRHEDLVADFEGQVRGICRFLGLPWNEAMRDIGHRPRSGLVASPSSRQLLHGLADAGLQKWRRYENQLAPFYTALEPWVRRFGYS